MTGQRFTVIGAPGFVGRNLASALEHAGADVARVGRGDAMPSAGELGHVIDCAGRTVDAVEHPEDTWFAHVERVEQVLAAGGFDSYLYISSTKLYLDANSTQEDVLIHIDATDPAAVLEASKLAGEHVCMKVRSPQVRIARLTNVYGDDRGSGTFLSTIIDDALERGHIQLISAASSEKDFVSIDDVVRVLPAISLQGRARRYNVATGRNLTSGKICTVIARATGCTWDVDPTAPPRSFPVIDIARLAGEFPVPKRNLLEDLAGLIAARREPPSIGR